LSELPDVIAPTVRLAMAQGQAERNGTLEAPAVRLAWPSGGQGGPGYRGEMMVEADDRPALLVSYFYLDPFLANRHRYRYRDWVMDSGAFSAKQSGAAIDLQAYIECCQRLLATDPTLSEVYALDVIGDWRATIKNAEAMWAAGVPAIPCYHVGSPESVLKGLARDYPKIALGGAVGYRQKDAWAAQCFARVWPKPIHGFGFGAEASIMALPWHSVDATNWELGPCKFGRWQSFGNMSVRGSRQNLRAEVDWYLRLERRARARWRKEMAQLPDPGPTLRFAIVNPPSASTRQLSAFEDAPAAPTVWLACGGQGDTKPTRRWPEAFNDPAASPSEGPS
jgi:hypothetical protein